MSDTPAQGTPPLASDELYEMCERCEGRGFADEYGYGITCPDCEGTGGVKMSIANLIARIAELERALEESWQPLPADSLIVWGLREMLMANGLEEYSDCTVCRRTSSSPTAGE